MLKKILVTAAEIIGLSLLVYLIIRAVDYIGSITWR